MTKRDYILDACVVSHDIKMINDTINETIQFYKKGKIAEDKAFKEMELNIDTLIYILEQFKNQQKSNEGN